MTYLGFTGLLAGVLTAALAVLVYWRCPNRQVAKAYGILNGCLSLWAFSYMIWQFCERPDRALFWMSMLSTFAMWVNQALLYFVFSLLDIQQKKAKLLWICAVVNLIFTYLNHAGLLYGTVDLVGPWGYWPRVKPLFSIYLLFWHAELLYAAFVLWRGTKAVISPEKKNQLRYFLAAFAVGYAGGVNNWFLWFRLPFPPYLNILVSVYVLMVAYAILKLQLMDIRILIRKTLAYSIIAALITAADLFIVSSIAALSQSWMGGTLSAAIATSFFAALTFRPLLRWTQRRVDAWFDFPDPERDRRVDALSRTLGMGLVHEVKMPLANVSLPVQLTLLELEDAVAGRRAWDDVAPNALDRLRYVLDQTHTAAQRVDAVDQTLVHPEQGTERVDLKTVLERSLAVLKYRLERAGVDIRYEIELGLPPLLSSTAQLDIVFTNVLKNALEALETSDQRPRRIVVKAKKADSGIEIRISDSGPGIPPSHAARIFELGVTTKGSGGAGIGLYLARKIMQQHGGVISIESSALGGAAFVLRFREHA